MPARAAFPLALVFALAACSDAPGPLGWEPEPSFAIDPVTLCCADVWTATGTFRTVVEDTRSEFTGLGTSFLTWGRSPTAPSSVELRDVVSAGAADGSFPSAGIILGATFSNGAIFGGTGINGGTFDVDLTGCSDDGVGGCVPDGTVTATTLTFIAINTPNVADPDSAADGLFIPDASPQPDGLGMWVRELQTATFNILYTRRSPIQIVDIEVVEGEGFVSVGDEPVRRIEVDVDIKPGSDRNSINPRSNGRLWVAVLGSEEFDVGTVDPASLLFGPAGAEPDRVEVHEVNGDGIPDLRLRVRTPDTGIVCGDTVASLFGKTTEGRDFSGRDLVRTTGCNRGKK